MENNDGHTPSGTDTDLVYSPDGEVCVKKGKSLIQVDKQFVVSTVLSIGTTAALIVFVIQAFHHPESAALLASLVFVPIMQLAVKLATRECPTCKRKAEQDAEP